MRHKEELKERKQMTDEFIKMTVEETPPQHSHFEFGMLQAESKLLETLLSKDYTEASLEKLFKKKKREAIKARNPQKTSIMHEMKIIEWMLET